MNGNDAAKIIDTMLSAKQGTASFLTEREKEALKVILKEHRAIKTTINHLTSQREYAENNHKNKDLLIGLQMSIDALKSLTGIEDKEETHG